MVASINHTEKLTKMFFIVCTKLLFRKGKECDRLTKLAFNRIQNKLDHAPQ